MSSFFNNDGDLKEEIEHNIEQYAEQFVYNVLRYLESVYGDPLTKLPPHIFCVLRNDVTDLVEREIWNRFGKVE